MQGSVDAREQNGFHPLLASHGLDYTRCYFKNRFPSLRYARENIDLIDLSSPQARITPQPSLRMKIKGSLLYVLCLPFATTLNGRSFTKEESRALRRSMIEDCDIITNPSAPEPR